MTFAQWIEAEKLDAAALAALTGFHRTYTWKVLTGRRQPSMAFMRRCIEVAGGQITANSFFAAPAPEPGEVAA